MGSKLDWHIPGVVLREICKELQELNQMNTCRTACTELDPRSLLAFDEMDWICSDQLKSAVKITPRYLYLNTLSKGVSLRYS